MLLDIIGFETKNNKLYSHNFDIKSVTSNSTKEELVRPGFETFDYKSSFATISNKILPDCWLRNRIDVPLVIFQMFLASTFTYSKQPAD